MTYINAGMGAPRPNQPKPASASYLRQFEAEFLRRLNTTENELSIASWVCEKIIESYRNGIAAGQNGAKVIRKGKSRGRGTPVSAE